jgi:hypothetical protein
MNSGFWIGLALIAVFIARQIKRMRIKREAQRMLREPGVTPDNPLTGLRLPEIDEYILKMSCGCGGGFRPVSEGSLQIDGRELRVARLVCGRCESERALYFEPPPLLH